MAISKGISKVTSYKKETNWGELAGAAGAQQLRRVTSNFNLTAESYQSNEINPTRQLSDMRLGTRSVDGALNGELSPKTYADFMASVVARDWTAGLTLASVTVDIAAGVGTKVFTLTRSTGSWITDSMRVGMVIRLTGAVNAANNGNNLLVIGVTTLGLTVQVLSETPMVAETAAVVAVAQTGKATYAPLTGHTEDSYTVEEWYSDIAQSEVFTGCKVGSAAFQMPSTGLVTCDFTFMGKNLEQSGGTQYFTSPTAVNSEGIFASVSGAVVVNGTPVALITSIDFTIERAMEPATVVGSNFAPEVFTGRIGVTGNMSVYFKDGTFRDYFKNESQISVVMALSTGSEKDAEVMTFVMPRVKLGSATKNDGELGLVQDQSFTALLAENDTTIYMQDTSLV